MSAMVRVIVCFLFIVCGIVESKAQVDGKNAFEKDGWGISVQSDFKVGANPLNLAQREPSVIKIYKEPNFAQRPSDKFESWSVGTSAFYLWHPFKHGVQIKPFFSRFGIGVEYNRFGRNKQFMFNGHVLLGYTFKLKKVGLDVFTGPVAKIQPNYRTYIGEYGEVEQITGPKPTASEISLRMYTWGVDWRFGVCFNYQSVGIFLAYNQPMGYFEHYKILYYGFPDKPLPLEKSPRNNRQAKTLTAGFQFRF